MSWIKTTGIILLVTLSLLVVLETSARLFYNSPVFNVRKFINSKPVPFRNDKNFSIVAKNLYDCQMPDIFLSNDGIPYFGEDWSCTGTSSTNNKRVTKPKTLS